MIKIGQLGMPGRFGTPSTLRFEVPEVPAGDYTVAIWFKGYATGSWGNALAGIHPLLTIRAADSTRPAATEGGSERRFWALAVVAGALLAASGLTGSRPRRGGGAPR